MNQSSEQNFQIGRGILLLLTTVLLFSLMDAITKYLTQTYPVIMILWVRFVFHTILVVLFIYPRIGLQLLKSVRPGIQLARGVALISASILFVTGLKFLPMADASTIAFLGPLLVTVLAVIFLKEKVILSQWLAIFASFIGVLIIIRPGSDVFTWASLLPFANAFCFATYQVLTRKLSGVENTYTTTFYTGLIGALFLSLAVPFFWLMPQSAFHASLFLMVGLLGGLSHMVMTKAYDYAPASTLAPFSYSQLIWVTVLGYVVFDDFPDRLALIGIVIVMISGIFAATRQRRGRIVSPTILPKDADHH